jgi:hypothetical protein
MTEFVLWVLVGFAIFVAWRVTQATNEMTVSRELINQVMAQKFIVMRLEENEYGVFAYRFKTGEFLAQGQNFDEMAENFKTRFPDKTGLIAHPEGYEKEIS